jgi:hypothetical protein
MKKKTVITTEKREVWVIRQPSGEASPGDVIEQDPDNIACSLDAQVMPSDEHVETDRLSDEQN